MRLTSAHAPTLGSLRASALTYGRAAVWSVDRVDSHVNMSYYGFMCCVQRCGPWTVCIAIFSAISPSPDVNRCSYYLILRLFMCWTTPLHGRK